MKIVITGGLGFIGKYLTRRLLSLGHEIMIIDTPAVINKNPPQKDCQIVSADITNYDSLREIVAHNFDAVLHLAAQSSGPRSIEIPDIDIQINVLGTLNVIRWCRDNQIKRLIFASSFVVYGDPVDAEILSEKDYCKPKSIYALSKYTCEQLLEIYATPHGINWNVLRMFNVYGPGQDLTRGDQGIVAIFLNFIRNGNHVPVKGRLDRFRDLIYIEDVVQGWDLCLHDTAHPNQIYNLGSGSKTYISALIDTLIAAYEKTGQVTVEVVGSTPGDIMGCYADIAKISTHLGYKPNFDLQRGIQAMVAWAKSL